VKTRRKFLTDTGKMTLMLSALDTVFNSLVHSKLNSAFAQATGNFKQFLHINFYASPPRWHYDLFLNPTNDPNLFKNGAMITNRFTGDATKYDGATYSQVQYGTTGTYIPYLFGQNVTLGNGSSVKGWDVLNNMIAIRGIDIMNAAHTGANQLHQQAVVGAPTISSMTADRATISAANPVQNVIRATQLNPSVVGFFKSQNGHASFRFDVRASVNNLSNLFTALRPISTTQGFNATFVNNLGTLEDKISSAVSAMTPQTAGYYKNLLNDNAGAIRILTDESITTFQSLATEWDALFNKYKNLLDGVLAKTVPGINDKRVGVAQTAANKEQYSWRQGTYVGNMVSGQIDLRSMLDGAHLDLLASQFAVVEFLMVRKISPSISFIPAAMQNVLVNGNRMVHYFDQHSMGRMVGILVNTFYFMAFNAALLELIRVLKANNIFNDTLIYMAPEFNRSARSFGPTAAGGSDHGALAGNASLISGRIANFKLIGNIYKDSAGTNTPYSYVNQGCWGVGAPIGGSNLNIIQVWGSVMALLGMPIPDIPNLVNKNRLIFRTAGSFAASAPFNAAPVNVVNTSKTVPTT
jgi:hypothetical protein